MKLLIASDIHGSFLYCEKLLQAYDREKADRMLLLGDLLYHGPRNDLPEQYAPKDVISALNQRKNEILCVRGNCDTEVDQMVLAFPIMADYALIVDGFYRMYATHGHLYHPDRMPPLQAGEILLYGHTHMPAWETRGNVRCFNPGSVSIPKGESRPGYLVFRDGLFEWKTLDGETYETIRAIPAASEVAGNAKKCLTCPDKK